MTTSTTKRVYKSLTTTQALSQVLQAAQTIELRQSVKPHEGNRIANAFHLAGHPEFKHTTRTEKRRERYKWLLKEVLSDSGPEAVVACVFGIGKTGIGNMRIAELERLPGEILRNKERFKTPYIQELARRYGYSGKQSTSIGIMRLILVDSQLAQPRRIMNSRHQSFIQARL